LGLSGAAVGDTVMPSAARFEVIIVGGGIAGASLAYFLSERGMTDVLIVEREEQPGYHATGRSAAVLVEWDPLPPLQALKALGAAFLRHPPAGFSEHPLLQPSGILVTFQEPMWSAVREILPLFETRGTVMQRLAASEVLDRVPVLSSDCLDGGVLLPDDGHIDVHELLWSYLRHAGRRGVQRRCGVEVQAIRVAGAAVAS
jgi:D-arginine dehydrogenase